MSPPLRSSLLLLSPRRKTKQKLRDVHLAEEVLSATSMVVSYLKIFGE